eukprot:gene10188-11274_t
MEHMDISLQLDLFELITFPLLSEDEKILADGKLEDEQEEDDQDSLSKDTDALLTKEELIEERRKKKRARRRLHYRRTHPFSRIFNSDIRKQFPTMWTNVWNSTDPVLYGSFIRHFASKFMLAGNNYEDPTTEKQIVQQLPYAVRDSSIEKSIYNYAFQCASGDDLLCQMLGCEIRRSRYSAGTDICLHLRISGTRLYELKFPLDREGDIDLSNLNQYRVRSANPMFMSCTGLMVFHFDEANNFMDKYWFFVSNFLFRAAEII